MALNRLSLIPKELYHCQAKDLLELLDKPTFIKIKGQKDDYLFIAVLLHGNETSSFTIFQKLIHDLKEKSLTRGLAIFIGNVRAANKGLRKLDYQIDYNRVWKQGQSLEDSEYQFVTELKAELKKIKLFAALDIHNTSGDNPEYACITNFNHHSYLIAQNFSDYVINFIKPDTVLCQYTSKICPSVVLECGLPQSKKGIESAYKLINKLLNINRLDDLSNNSNALVYFTHATIKIKPKTSIEFSEHQYSELNTELLIRKDIESFNFRTISSGEIFALSQNILKKTLRIQDNQKNDVTDQFIEMEGNQLKVKAPFIPCMLTSDPQIARDDCLGYIIKALPSGHYQAELSEVDANQLPWS